MCAGHVAQPLHKEASFGLMACDLHGSDLHGRWGAQLYHPGAPAGLPELGRGDGVSHPVGHTLIAHSPLCMAIVLKDVKHL